MMKKVIMNMRVVENRHIHALYSLLRLTPADGSKLPEMLPGQFVQVEIPDSSSTFLRRPISINFVDTTDNTLWLLIRNAGKGTARLIESPEGLIINLILPLGNSFSMPEQGQTGRLLLIGGGVGVAPMLQLGKVLKLAGFSPEFLLGARSKTDLLEVDMFEETGVVHISTDDGSFGEKGLVTQHSALADSSGIISKIYCCGPAPMMKAVASIARKRSIDCEVSLENMMACGLGACLCCVENTVKGNVCVCTEGPVFNINQLTWHD